MKDPCKFIESSLDVGKNISDDKLFHLDEQHRRGLQAYIFDLEEIKEEAEELTLANEKLKSYQDLLLTVLCCAVQGLCLVRQGKIVWCNEAMKEIFGWECGELTGRSVNVLCDPASTINEHEEVKSALLQGGMLSREMVLRRKDKGSVFCYLTCRAPDPKNPSKGYVLSFMDFTERHRAQEALKDACDELSSRSLELIRINEELNREIEERKRVERKLNKYKDQLEELVGARTAELTEVNELLRSEIKERASIEEALRKSENEYRTIFENTGTATVIIEEDKIISLANAEFEKLSGFTREEIEGRKKWIEMVDEGEEQRMAEYHRLRRLDPLAAPRQYEFRFKRASGEIRNVFLTVDVIPGTRRSVSSMLDITMQKVMEAEALKAHKLESLGILAGGIAHDFNNILTAILGNVSLAKMWTRENEKVFSRLEETERASLRAKELTQQLLTFSKGGKPVKKTISLAELIEDSARFSLRGSKVMLELALADDLLPVEADEGQISQVINNLAINADQAMPVGGALRIEAGNVAVDASSTVPLIPGRYVRVKVSDHGIGIAAEHLGRIFDPYFSTKHKGSGLGLATVYSILKSHGGHITAESQLGRGTSFTFHLPASENRVEHRPGLRDIRCTGRGSILVMDDEELVREVLGEMLRAMGYDPSFAVDGAEAVEMYSESLAAGRPYDLIIMDLTIPGGMGGQKALHLIHDLDPLAKAIVSSGYSNSPVMSEYENFGFLGVVSKPYRLEDLARSIERVMKIPK